MLLEIIAADRFQTRSPDAEPQSPTGIHDPLIGAAFVNNRPTITPFLWIGKDLNPGAHRDITRRRVQAGAVGDGDLGVCSVEFQSYSAGFCVCGPRRVFDGSMIAVCRRILRKVPAAFVELPIRYCVVIRGLSDRETTEQ